MILAFAIFWSVLIVLSIAWHAFLLFYIGFKGGKEILEMTAELRKRNSRNQDKK